MEHNVVVMCCGYNLLTSDWDKVVWGNPRAGLWGRSAQAMRVALMRNAPILFNTGNTSIDGVSEARWMADIIRIHINEITDSLGVGAEKVEAVLDRSIFEEKSVRTSDSMQYAVEILRDLKASELVVVSSANHVSRCLRDALIEIKPEIPNILVSAVAADTNYGGKALASLEIRE